MSTVEERKIKKGFYSLFIKRLFDIIISLFSIIIFSPIFIVVYLLVLVDSGKYVIFKQVRVGKNKKRFKIYKFRTMVIDADKIGSTSTMSGDKRITKIGCILRRTSLDELPQLFNVLKGDMSIIGPRPDVPESMSLFTEEHIEKRMGVRPGITGLAQVNGRSNLSLEDRVYYDEKYCENISFKYDINIIFLTVNKIIKKEGTN